MNGSTWSHFIFSGYITWGVGEDTYQVLKDKKTLEALSNVLAGAAPDKPQKGDLLYVDPHTGIGRIPGL